MIGLDDIGQRVVVRRTAGVIDGRRRFTDVTGRFEAADTQRVSVRRDNGDLEAVPRAAIVTAKVIPPKPTPYSEISRVEAACAHSWPAEETRWRGGWLLRASGGWSRRANSVLALGDPGTDVDTALADAEAWYAARGLPTIFVLPLPLSRHLERDLRQRGWNSISDVDVLTTDTPRLAAADAEVTVSREPNQQWLELAVGAEAERAHPLLRRGDCAFASIERQGELVACGRAAVVDKVAVLSCLAVSPRARREGLGKRVMGALAEWASTRSASHCCVQVAEPNAAAHALYAGLGFAPHHRHVYLRRDLDLRR